MGKKERLVFMFDTGPVIIFRLNDAGILVAMSRDHEVRMRHLLHRYLEKMEYIPDDEMVEVTSLVQEKNNLIIGNTKYKVSFKNLGPVWIPMN